ncbi:MAG: GIY-YIG nuclease family protein [Bacteroidota bacterium]
MTVRRYYVYILTNDHHTVLYTGVTNDLRRRLAEHRAGQGSSFTKRYNAHKLVYAESFRYVNDAIAREKQIKGGSRQKKLDLIEQHNPEWLDLGESLALL